MNAVPKPRVQFTEKAVELFKPHPYKVMHGGRGGAKTWDMVRALLTLGMNRPLFVLVTRDIQRSIRESVHKLLCDQIGAMGYQGFYTPYDTEVVGVNGTRFVFEGLRNNILSIKSMEAIDVCLVVEAEPISDPSWEILLPTVRRDPPFGPFGQGSEVWVEFNPELDSSPTYKRWVLDPPEGAVVIECNYWDNPWFPEILRRQMEEMKIKDSDAYRTVWCGKTRKALSGAIYANEMSAAIMENRVTPRVQHIRGKPVIVTCDLGKQDMTSLWFWQQIGYHHMAIHHYFNSGHDWPHYLQYIQDRKYSIGGLWLPHDARQDKMNITATPLKQSYEAYPQEGIVRCERQAIANVTIRINATRALFPRIYISEDECADGIISLQRYRYGVNPLTKQRTTKPVHDQYSHDADGFGYYAQWLQEGLDSEAPPQEDEIDNRYNEDNLGWMRG